MEVTIEEKGPHDRLMTIRVPAARVAELLNKELDGLVRNAKIAGFRPGKAPRGVVEAQFSDYMLQEVKEKLVRETLNPALMENSLHMLGTPSFEVGEISRQEDFVYHVSLQIFPQVVAEGYRGLVLDRVHYQVSQEDVEQVVSHIRESHAKWEARPEREAQLGDEVMIDFRGTLDGEEFAGGADTNYPLELGRKRFIGDFEEQLVGIKSGESRQVRVTFPENYPNTKLAGRDALFDCTAREVRERILPELDDTLAVKAGIKEGGIPAMLEDIQQRLKEEAKRESDRRIKQQIFGKLLESNPLDLPSQMVEQEVTELKESLRQENRRQGGNPDDLDLDAPNYRDHLEKSARERLSLGLMVGSIASRESVAVNDAQLDQLLEAMTAQYGEHAAAVRDAVRGNKQRMEELRGSLLESQVIAWIIENGQVTEQEQPFAAIGKAEA